MKVTKSIAEQIMESARPMATYGFDPTILLVIIQALQAIVPLLQDACEKGPEDVAEIAKNMRAYPHLLHNQRRFRALRRCVRDRVGRDDYLEAGGDTLINSMVEVASGDAGVDECRALFADVNAMSAET